MGQIADSMINGSMCSTCGVCFHTAHGFPVVCSGCWNELTKRERKEAIRANPDYEDWDKADPEVWQLTEPKQ